MEKNNSEKYFLLLGMFGGCILASYLVFVLVKNGTDDTTFATLCFVIIAAVSCCGTYLIFNKLYNLVPKSERERRKKEAQEEERKKQLAETPKPEPAPQPIQVDVHNYNAVITKHEIINEVNTEVNVEAPNITVEAPKQEAIIVPKSEPVDFDTLIDESSAKQPDIDCSVCSEDYKARNAEFIQAQESKHNQMLKAVVEYSQRTMTPYMKPTEIEKLCHEILAWAKDTDYKPNAVVVDGDLSTYDVSHFIWNIAERLGTERRYTGENKGWFIKRLFPKICSHIEASTLTRNLKTRPNEGKIYIDEMEKNSKTNTHNIAFHYSTE